MIRGVNKVATTLELELWLPYLCDYANKSLMSSSKGIASFSRD